MFLLLACAARHALPPSTPPKNHGEPTHDALVCEPAAWPERIREALLAARDRGLLLARRDRYAWEATDRAQEATGGLVEIAPRWGLLGYATVERAPGDATVFFVGERDGAPVVRARVDLDATHPNGAYREITPPEPASPEVIAQIRARAAALADPRFEPKVARYNADAIPWSTDPADGWAVYLVAAAIDANAVPLGGGYRAHVSPDGKTVLEMEPLSRGVLTVPVEDVKRQEGSFVATVFTPVPDPTYVAFPIQWGIPLLIASGDDAFLLAGERICWGAL